MYLFFGLENVGGHSKACLRNFVITRISYQTTKGATIQLSRQFHTDAFNVEVCWYSAEDKAEEGKVGDQKSATVVYRSVNIAKSEI